MVSRLVRPHPRRDLILAVLRENPGQGFRELSRLTGICHGALSHHVLVLQRQGRLWTTDLSPRVLHYAGPRPLGEVAVRSEVVEHALDEVDQELLARAEKPTNQKTFLAAFSGRMPVSTVQSRLYALCERRLLRQERRGRFVRYQALPTANAHEAASREDLKESTLFEHRESARVQ